MGPSHGQTVFPILGRSRSIWNSEPLVGLCSCWNRASETLWEYLKMVMVLDYKKPPYAMLRNNLEVLLQRMPASPYDPLDLQMVP